MTKKLTEYNFHNMPLAVLHVADKHIDSTSTETSVWGVDAVTGEILAKETVERGMFGNEEKQGSIRDMVVGLRIRGFKTYNEGGEYIE